jgi:multidrug efflux pump subunit AcrA (membrane-fusion protein)
MNRSLPEVAAQYVNSGTVTTRIRGTGTVTANEQYEVKLSQSRTVQSVAVRTGDEVAVGDTLLYLSGDTSDELKQAQDTLDDLELAYEKALIAASSSDYARENRDIQNARTALQEAEAERDALYVSDDELAKAKSAVDSAKSAVSDANMKVTAAQADVDSAQQNLEALGGYNEGSSGGDYSVVTQASSALTEAKNTLAAKKLQYGTDYDAMKATAEANRGSNTLVVYMKYLAEVYSTEAEGSDEFKQYTAYTEITNAEKAVEDAQAAYNSAVNSYNSSYVSGNTTEWNKRNNALKNANSVLTQAQKVLTQAEAEQTEVQNAYDALVQKRADYKTAQATVKSCQTSLEDLIFNLQEQQKTDSITSQTNALDLAAQKKDIDEKTAEIAQLKADSTGQTVQSSVAGIVKSIAVSAGSIADPDTALITIEVPDRGYYLSFSVTNEQAKKVQTGDAAEVSNYYWGGDITATLAGVRTDPENPQTNKLLTFSISGDVESGTQLTLSVGQKSANYDMIVPNSALRSDSNGDFVLIVVAKSSPLGNRYVTQRADVKILASDDTNTAVSGALASGDYVITTSTKPLEVGMQVRIAD